MALTHLLETSLLARLGDPVIQQAILELEADPDPAELGRTDISDLEIGFSARNAPEWDKALTGLEVFELVRTTTKDVRRAKQVQRLLAVKHQRGRKVPDLPHTHNHTPPCTTEHRSFRPPCPDIAIRNLRLPRLPATPAPGRGRKPEARTRIPRSSQTPPKNPHNPPHHG